MILLRTRWAATPDRGAAACVFDADPVRYRLHRRFAKSAGAMAVDRLYQLLQNRIEGVVSTPDQFHPAQLTNFGNLYHWTPRFVVEPASARDVAAVGAFAREHGLTISGRRPAHSPSRLAISNGGVLPSMSSLCRLPSPHPSRRNLGVAGGWICGRPRA